MAANHAEHQWNLDNLKDRYHDLDLDNDQAEKIQRYETGRDQPWLRNFPSHWEELDWEWFVFRDILNPEQFLQFEQQLKKRKNAIIDSLKEQDQEAAYKVDEQIEKYDFYKNTFLPGVLAFRENHAVVLYQDHSKVQYLKEQYRNQVHNYRQTLISEHLRESRRLQPNEFKVRQYYIYMLMLWPSYDFFGSFDEPAKLMYEDIGKRAGYLAERNMEFFEPQMKLLAAFHQAMIDKYHKERMKNSIVLNFGQTTTKEKELQHFAMSMILADPPFYSEPYELP